MALENFKCWVWKVVQDTSKEDVKNNNDDNDDDDGEAGHQIVDDVACLVCWGTPCVGVRPAGLAGGAA